MKNIQYLLILFLTASIITSFTKIEKKEPLVSFKYTCTAEKASVQAIATGDWNNTATWSNNQIPTSNDDVVIPAGIRVSLSGTMAVRTIRVDGNLGPLNLNTDLNLTTKGIMVHDGGLFQIGSETNPYTANGTITLTGSDPAEVLMGNTLMGSKLIGVMSNARLELHGVQRKTWTQLNATAEKGATSITLKEQINWKIGDQIVIASTDFDPHQAEKRTITAINNTTISFDTPLEFMHFGVEQTYTNGTKTFVLDERAEVGLLTHNLKIQGDVSSESNGFGGHIMSMPNSISRASNIELFRMGQKSQIGKYPWHWHLLGDADGQYIKNAGIHTSYNRLITVHATNNTIVEGNVGYDFLGHGYFLEDGNETGNLFKNNLGVLCKRPKEGEETRPHDLGIGADRGASPEAFPATFWITNPNNDFIGNVSAGSDGSGFWHLILDEVLDDSNSNYVPGNQPMGIFDDNKAHSNLFSWGIDGGIDKTTEEIVNGHYRPKNADGSQFIPVINRFDGYKSVDRNVWIRANTMNFYDCDFGDNGRADFFSYNQTLFNSLIVGKSANIGNPKSASEIQAGRSLPFPSLPLTAFTNAFRGHSIYDGPSGIVDTHFAGFDSNGAKSYCFQINGASRKSTNHFARGITYDVSVAEDSKFDFDHISYFSYMFLSGLIDEDGSVTGVAGTNIRPILIENPNNRNLYEKGANTQQTNAIEKPEFGAWLTQNKTYNYFKDIDFTNKDDGAFTPRYFIAEYPDKTSHAVFNVQTQQQYFDAPVITNDLDYTYYLQYHKLPKYMVSSLDGCKTNSENVIVAYPNMPGISYAGNATRVTSFAALKSSSNQSYFIKDNTIYFKLISTDIQNDFFRRQFGEDYKYETDAFICNSGNCFDSSSWGNIVGDVTLIDYSVRSMDLGSVETNDDSRDSATSTDGLTIPTFNYANTRVNFTVENNGNGIDGYTDYEINLSSRQVWEYFNTLNLNFSGADVEVIVQSENGQNFSVGSYNSSDSSNIRIGQDTQFDKFTNVKKLILRFYESKIGDINTASSSNITINFIKLGSDVPDNYSVSSTKVEQDSDGDGILDSAETNSCRNPNSASDFALEFNGDSTIFDGFSTSFINNPEIANGVFKGTSTSNDPKIINEGFVSFSGSDINTLTFRYKANTPNTRVQLFWQTTENSSYAASRSVQANYTGNGDWQELSLDVSSNTEWQNKIINSLRIDPTNNDNVSFEIDWIRANNAIDPTQQCIPEIDTDGDGLFDKEEEDLCRDINSSSDFAIEFNGDDIFDNYTAQQIDNLVEENGVLKGTTSGTDSKLIKLDFLEMAGAPITDIIVRMKANIDITKFQIFWEVEGGSINAARSVVKNYTGNGAWQELSLDLSTNNEWIGKKIKGLRIDPTNNNNVSFEIDWIRAQNAKNPETSCATASVDENILEDNVSIYPNPSKIGNPIKVIGIGNFDKIYVYDLNGKQISIRRYNDSFRFVNSQKGIYLIKIILRNGNFLTKKLIIN
ncbi:T9SS type A sorting domain-containing protein [Polaribacter aestuariivivens]|uniref:T9SS type A sorting domain-containing protein n=1 Tax=Polaribacter aestuariivivens TaxID=2304626 RepID=A0A5S3N7W0_9FLAO|nr:G8 domain-containing protein [Polaribacter aestuariivivens]TMM30634.1 T9SS type A sorting domain-containing protein [Polaribacter aestuariivivens]